MFQLVWLLVPENNKIMCLTSAGGVDFRVLITAGHKRWLPRTDCTLKSLRACLDHEPNGCARALSASRTHHRFLAIPTLNIRDLYCNTKIQHAAEERTIINNN